jgi:transposase
VVDWKAVKRVYRRTGSIKQAAAQFKLSVNSVKARIRREGWSHE